MLGIARLGKSLTGSTDDVEMKPAEALGVEDQPSHRYTMIYPAW